MVPSIDMYIGYNPQTEASSDIWVERRRGMLGQPQVGHEKPTHFIQGAEMSKREIVIEGLKTLLLFVMFAALTITGFLL